MYAKKRRFASRPRSLLFERTLAIVAGDQLILDDVTRYGLHRRHVIRYGGPPDVEGWRMTVPERARHWSYVDERQVGHLWMAWKEKENG